METQGMTEQMAKAARVFETRGLNGQEEKVANIKAHATQLLMEIDKIEIPSGSDAARLVALAKTNLEQAVMWAVKALSRNH